MSPAGQAPDTAVARRDDGPPGAGAPEEARPAEPGGRRLSTEAGTAGTGRVVGVYVTEGSAAFGWFDYRRADPGT
ncbi:hypothetical protein V1L54_15595 [Streptomyces sp. TRM 70361]|uniref:hypothetical protein n=1 Tax=Streptomyces sp. TRM 70361 TaxID=3116553 RepID=UPI002E7BBBB4|nr:hypothetical protein [Streptomyces sp. TRM 70361]MEE1940810.1 hypothetical protein [Streptomyces sp. TRM 70361]